MTSKTVEVIVRDVFQSAGGFAGLVAGFKNVQTASEDATKSASNLEPMLNEQGSKASETGKKVGAAVGVAVGGAIVSGFASSVSFDASRQKLEASFAEGSAAAKVAGEATGKLYADGYTESYDEIGQATKKVMQSTDEMKNATTEQVTEITGQFLSLSKVMGVDVGSAIESVATLVKTKMAPDMQSGLDLVTAAYQKLGPAADGVIGAVQKNAEEFQRLGIGGKEAMGLIVQGMDAGAGSADAVTNSFKLFTNTVLSGTKASEEGLKSLGLATDILGPKSKAAGDTASASFSVSAADADHARQIIEDMGLSIDTIKDKADKSGKTTSESFKVGGAAVDELQTKLDDAGIKMTSFSDTVGKGSKNAADQMKVIGINADDIRGKLAAGGETANAAFTDIINRLKDIKDPLEQNTIGTQLFGKSWKTVSESILAFDPSQAAAGLGKVDGAAKAMNATVEDTAQNKLTAMKNRFQEFTADIVNAPGILGTATTSIAAFGVSGVTTLGSLAQVVSALPEGFSKSAMGVVKAMGSMAMSFATTAGEAMVHSAVVGGSWIATNTAMAASTVATGIKMLASYVASFVATAAQAVVSAAITAGAWIAANIAMIAATGGILLAVGAVIAIALLVIQHWGAVKDFFVEVGHVIADIGSWMWDGIKTGAREMVNAVIDYLNAFVETINAILSGVNMVPGVNIPMIPHIPHASFATGGISSGGLAVVGEYGAELVDLPSGSIVRSNADSQAMTRSSAPTEIHITIDSGGSTMDDLLVQILRSSIRKSGGGNVQLFLGTS